MGEGEGLSRRQLIVGSIAAVATANMTLPVPRPNPWLSIRGGVRGLREGQLERILASSSTLFGE